MAQELAIPAQTICQFAALMGALFGGVYSPWKTYGDVKETLSVFKHDAEEKIKRGVPAYRVFLRDNKPLDAQKLTEASVPALASQDDLNQIETAALSIVMLQNRVILGRSLQPSLDAINGLLELVVALNRPEDQKAFLILVRKWGQDMFLSPDEQADRSSASPFTLATRFVDDFYGAGTANTGLRKIVARWRQIHVVGTLPLVAFRAIKDEGVPADVHASNVSKLLAEPRHFGVSTNEFLWLTGEVPLQLQDRLIDQLILNRDVGKAVRAGFSTKKVKATIAQPLLRWALLPERNERVAAFDALAKQAAAHKNGQTFLAAAVNQFDPMVWYDLSGAVQGLLSLKKPPAAAISVVVEAARRWGGRYGRQTGTALASALTTKSLDPLTSLGARERDAATAVFHEMFPSNLGATKEIKVPARKLEAKPDGDPLQRPIPPRVRGNHIADPLLRKRVAFIKEEDPALLPKFSEIYERQQGTPGFKFAIEDDHAFAVVVQVLTRGKKEELGKLESALNSGLEEARGYFAAQSITRVVPPASPPADPDADVGSEQSGRAAKRLPGEIRIPPGYFTTVFVITQPPKVVDHTARLALAKEFPDMTILYPDWKEGSVTGGGVMPGSLVVVIKSRVSHAYKLEVIKEATDRKATLDFFDKANYSGLSEYLTKLKEQNGRTR